MKKILLSLLCFLGFGLAASATDPITINGGDMTDFGNGNGVYAGGTYTSGVLKFEFTSAYSNSGHIRIGKSSDLTISTTDGSKIVKIEFTATTTAYKLNDASNISWSGTTGTFTNEEGVTSQKFSNSSANIARISKFVVTLAEGSASGEDPETPVTVAAPTFSVPEGEVAEGTVVTISCAEEYFIMYTTNGEDPSFENEVGELKRSSVDVTINATTTIKAIAVDNDGHESKVVSATYTIAEPVSTETVVYKRVEKVSDGGHYIIVGVYQETETAPKYVRVMENGLTSGKFHSFDATSVDGDEITIPQDNNAAIVTFSKIEGTETYNLLLGNKYISWNSSTNLRLDDESGNNSVYTVTYNSKDNDFAIEFTADSSSNPRGLRFNPSKKNKSEERYFYFGAYNTDGGQTNVQLFKKAGEDTGIEAVAVENEGVDVYYNLQGVRVENPTSGLYIRVNGKKVSKVLVK